MSLFSMFTKQNNVLSPQEAYKRMKEDTDAIILDVWTFVDGTEIRL